MYTSSLCTLFGIVQLAVSVSALTTIQLTAIPKSCRGRRCPPLPPRNTTDEQGLQDIFKGTDLQWVGSTFFGTPPQGPFITVFDTGSQNYELPGITCDTCINETKFDPRKSSTFVSRNETITLSFDTGTGVAPVTPGELSLTGNIGEDTLSMGDLQSPNVAALVITNQTRGFDNQGFDAILGLGSQLFPGSFMNGLTENGVKALFTFFLTPKKVGHAEITIGEIDNTKVHGSISYIPSANQGFWTSNCTGITVNGKTVSSFPPNTPITFDTGTSTMAFPKNFTENIYALISPEIQPLDAIGSYGADCDKFPSFQSDLNFNFITEDGQRLTLTVPHTEINVGKFPANPKKCQAYINALEDDSVLGRSLLKHYYTIWDLNVTNTRLGFVKNQF